MNWPDVALGSVAHFVRGINFKPEDVAPLESIGTVACMRTKNVQVQLDSSDVWAVPERFVKRSDQWLRRGDILVSSANSWNLVGKCCWIPELPWRASFGGFVSVLRGDPSQLNSRYLYWWFSSPHVQRTLRSFGRQTTNISNLSIDQCLRLKLALPPLAEQRRIAEVLDRADALRAKRRAALAKLDELTQSIFLDMFGDPIQNSKEWPTATLGEEVRFVGGGTPSRLYPEYFSGDTCWATSKDMRGRFLDDTQEHVTQEAIDWSATKVVNPGAILVVVKSKVLAHRLPVAIARVPTCFGQDLKAIIPDSRLTTPFVAEALRQGSRWLIAKTRGINTEGLSLEHLRSFPIPLPPTSLQNEFAKRLLSLENLSTVMATSGCFFEHLFGSLQHRAFQGEL